MYIDIRQSRLCSARLEASSGSRTKGVSTNNQRGRGSGLVSSEDVWTSPVL